MKLTIPKALELCWSTELLGYFKVKLSYQVLELNIVAQILQGIWNIIKGWLDPVVASKIHFTKTVEELENYIERSHILKELGGDDPYVYDYIEPLSGENDMMADEATRMRLLEERSAVVKEFESITQEWIKQSHGDNALQQMRDGVAERLRSGYWQLDPYLRARTIYDRAGLIREGGQIQFYGSPKATKTSTGASISNLNGPLSADHREDDLD